MATVITDHDLTKACDELAAEIFANMLAELPHDETPDDKRDEMQDRAHEAADGHQWVIYTHYALSICAHCNTDAGEEFVDEVGLPKPFTLAGAATAVAYGEIKHRVALEIDRLVDDWEDNRPTCDECGSRDGVRDFDNEGLWAEVESLCAGCIAELTEATPA